MQCQRFENRDDAMSKFEEAEKKEVCKLDKPITNSNNVDNEDVEKAIIRLAGVVTEVVFPLKCVVFLVVFFESVLFAKNWSSM